ncbi:variable surface protein [Plasmodium gonderi]|uniref:Variable surface protein n=1 Tax=Plasmodium gonderi TaxID=77519 RepID=A0A1Y1JPZ6_PLAGO|nr:variable surface protein [Plasmodium gonderi]GAW84280.1 variable surface protein [Plasmodium gonderi]
MTKDIYKFVDNFQQLENIMKTEEREKQPMEDADCNDIEKNKFQNFSSNIKNICHKALNYSMYIKTYYSNIDEESCCIYLYYWLYHTQLNGKNINDINFVYRELINISGESYAFYCNNHKNFKITDDEMTKLKDIYDLYSMLNNINDDTKDSHEQCAYANKCAIIYMNHKDTCKYNNFSNFCNALEQLKNKYNKKMSSSNCENGSPKTLPSLRSNNFINLTLIPIVFTTCGRSIRYEFIKKKKKYNNINKERNILGSSDAPTCDFRNNKYLILYNTH